MGRKEIGTPPSTGLSRRALLKTSVAATTIGSIAGCAGYSGLRQEPVNTQWRMHRRDAQNTGRNPISDYPMTDFRLSWSGDGAAVEESPPSPAITDSHAVVAGSDGTLRTYDISSGELVWQVTPDGSPLVASPAIGERNVYVATRSGRVAAYDVVSGSHAWHFPTSEEDPVPSSTPAALSGTATPSAASAPDRHLQNTPSVSGSFTTPPVVHEGRVYVQSDSPQVIYRLRTDSGEAELTYELSSGSAYEGMAIEGDHIYVGVSGALAALELAGTTLRDPSAVEPTFVEDVFPVAEDPVIHNGWLYAVLESGHLAAVDGSPAGVHRRSSARPEGGESADRDDTDQVDSGRLLWVASNKFGWTDAPAMDGSYVYARREDGTLSGIERTTGGIVWSATEIEATGPPTASGGLVYVPTGNSVTVVDGLTGEVLSSFDVGRPVEGDVVVVADRLFVTTAGAPATPPSGQEAANESVTADGYAPEPGTRQRLLSIAGDVDVRSLTAARSGKLEIAAAIDEKSVASLQDSQKALTALERIEDAYTNGEISFGIARGAIERLFWAEQTTDYVLTYFSTADQAKYYVRNPGAVGGAGAQGNTTTLQPSLCRRIVEPAIWFGISLVTEYLINKAAEALKTTRAVDEGSLARRAFELSDEALDNKSAFKSVFSRGVLDKFKRLTTAIADIVFLARVRGRAAVEEYIERLVRVDYITESTANRLRTVVEAADWATRERAQGMGVEGATKMGTGAFIGGELTPFVTELTNVVVDEIGQFVQRTAETGIQQTGAAGVTGAVAVGAWNENTIEQSLTELTDGSRFEDIRRLKQLPGSRQGAEDAKVTVRNGIDAKAERFDTAFRGLDIAKEEITDQWVEAVDGVVDEKYVRGISGLLPWKPLTEGSKAMTGMMIVSDFMLQNRRAVDQILRGEYEED